MGEVGRGGQRGAVALGGALGATSRALVDELAPGPAPVVTLLVNVVGALLLGAVLARVRGPVLRAGLGTGALGAWTTFSALAVQLDGLLRRAPVAALGLAAASVLAGLAAARLGLTGSVRGGHGARA